MEWGKLVLSEAKKVEEHYIMNPSPASERSWLATQTLHQQVTLTTAENKQFFIQQKYFEEEENTGHLMAVISRAQQGTAQIEAIRNPAGAMVQDVNQIIQVFSSYFRELY